MEMSWNSADKSPCLVRFFNLKYSYLAKESIITEIQYALGFSVADRDWYGAFYCRTLFFPNFQGWNYARGLFKGGPLFRPHHGSTPSPVVV